MVPLDSALAAAGLCTVLGIVLGIIMAARPGHPDGPIMPRRFEAIDPEAPEPRTSGQPVARRLKSDAR